LSQIIEINKKKAFSLEEAQELVPVILRLTESSNSKVRLLLQALEGASEKDSSKNKAIEEQIDLIIRQWQQKVERLGAKAKGLWLVDFDNGEGYFCWKYPERKIMFFHGYQDGFSGRKALIEGFADSEENYNREH
jgi:hypothetical protein